MQMSSFSESRLEDIAGDPVAANLFVQRNLVVVGMTFNLGNAFGNVAFLDTRHQVDGRHNKVVVLLVTRVASEIIALILVEIVVLMETK